MGKNQAYKQMQRAKHAASADGHFNEAEDGTVSGSKSAVGGGARWLEG